MIKPLALAIALIATPTIAQAQHADRYGTSQALRAQQVRPATVLMVREVQIQNDRTLNSGTAIGTAIGYGLASRTSSRNRSTARVVGGIVGGTVGTATAKKLSQRRAVEIYVQEEDRGRTYAIVQEMDHVPPAGAMVFITGHGNNTRVVGIQ